jgi:hypothetical protein
MRSVPRSLRWLACIAVLISLFSLNASAAADITQAESVTASQFLRSLKQVSLHLRFADGLADDYLPREMVQDELGKSGIAVRPNAPVALEVRLMDRTHNATETRTTYINGLPVSQRTENFQLHFLLLSMHFYVRGAVIRNNKFHVLPVAAASGWWLNHIITTGTQKELDASSRTAIRRLVAQGIADVLNDIDSDAGTESTPWPPASWTEKDRVQKNADFAKALLAPMDQSFILDLDVQPRLNLNPMNMDPSCEVASNWRRVWDAEFQRLKWTKPQPQPTITVDHRVDCQLQNYGQAGDFFRTVSTVYLKEENVLFELDGKLFRKSGVLLFSESFGAFEPKENARLSMSGEVLGRFASAINRGTRDAPRLAGEELAAIASSSKNLTGSLILGGDVRIDQGGWRYANGTSVPASLIDPATSGPPLRPKSQRPVTQAPVSTHVAEIKSVLGAIKSCSLYTSASRENLLWSVMSPALDLDDAGVLTSRYVLSTRPGHGYAQGAAIANLSLAAAQIQDRGCQVVSVPCKAGRCVRFEENANPSLTFFVETAAQANTVLNALRALAPLYPNGAGELRPQ